jgi:hypothetical protein
MTVCQGIKLSSFELCSVNDEFKEHGRKGSWPTCNFCTFLQKQEQRHAHVREMVDVTYEPGT